MHRLNRLSSLKFQLSRVLPLYSPNSFSFSTAVTRLQDFKHQLPIRGTDEKGQEVILSHVKSLSKEPLINMTIGRFFDAQVARYGDQSVLRVIHQNIDWSWKQLQREIDRLALGLLNLGLKPGDRVGVWLPNTYEWVMCQIATAKAGFVLVNINPAYRSYELQYALNLVDAKALIFTPSFKSSNYVQILQQLIPSLVSSPDAWSCDACPALRHLINIGPESVPGVKRFDDILAPEVASNPNNPPLHLKS
jgi:fatty-acyl-CoA synthase